MPEWLLKKTGLLGGFSSLSDRHEDDKGEATHVRLTVEEYDKLVRARNRAKKEKEEAESREKSNVESARIDGAPYLQIFFDIIFCTAYHRYSPTDNQARGEQS